MYIDRKKERDPLNSVSYTLILWREAKQPNPIDSKRKTRSWI